jgi:SpoVK/Ycf46/Vps4 family AAA+-type ATPase
MRSTDGVAEGANGEHASPPQAWTSVGGYASLKDHVRRYVTGPWLDRGSHHDVLGVVAASGTILHGPSGCGKSLTAAAIAAEAKANLVHVRSSELLSKWLGESERLVRRLFSRARAAAPCVLFFDDVDALVGRRNFEGGSSSGSTGKQGGLQTRLLTTLLNEIDGIGSSCGGYSDDAKSAKGKGVLVLAATNRPLSCLDPALLRPGRLQEHLFVGLPASVDDKKTILGLHTGRPAPLSPTALPRRSAPHSLSEHPISSSLHPPSSAPSNPKKKHSRFLPLAADVDLRSVAADARVEDFSCAELAALVRGAALHAMRTYLRNHHQKQSKHYMQHKEEREFPPITAKDFEASMREASLRRHVSKKIKI